MPRTPRVLIPTRPPRNEIELGDKQAEAKYYLWAFAEREPYKATYDMLIDA
jgi:hypothetical protein